MTHVAVVAAGLWYFLVLSACTQQKQGPFELTVLHNNDAESALVGSDGIGGVDRFASLITRERKKARDEGRGLLLLSSGDNFLAGRQFEASLSTLQDADPTNDTFFDAVAVGMLEYDALVIGNHDLDYGPEILATFIRETAAQAHSDPVFLSSNLDVSPVPSLSELRDRGLVASSQIFEVGTSDGTRRVGVVGATTPMVRRVSSPGAIVVSSDVRDSVQREIDSIKDQGVNVIILVSHLQSLEEDKALISTLRGVDFAIAGGGDELLAGDGSQLLPADSADEDGDGRSDAIAGPYPTIAADADSREIPIVTTSGGYGYLGMITLRFDADGEVESFDAEDVGPLRVVSPLIGPDGVGPSEEERLAVVAPVASFIADLDGRLVGTTGARVELDGRRESVRRHETGMGNLLADALRWQALQSVDGFGATRPTIAITNGGGIRNNVRIAPSDDITEGALFDAFPFSNFVAVVPGVDAATLKAALENAVCRVEVGDGRFAHVSGLRFEYDPSREARLIDTDGTVIQQGDRVRRVVLESGDVIVEEGRVVRGDIAFDIATQGFLAGGGDFYDWTADPSTVTPDGMQVTGESYRAAVAAFIRGPLGGTVSGDAYSLRGDGRVIER